MAKLTDDARQLGFRSDHVSLRADYVADHRSLNQYEGVELIIYLKSKEELTLECFGCILHYSEAIDLLAQIDTALRTYDARRVDQQGG